MFDGPCAISHQGLCFMPCRLVGADITHPGLHRHIHASTGEGVLAALGAASQTWPPGSAWAEAFQRSGITAAERQALRTLLLQVTAMSVLCAHCAAFGLVHSNT